MSTKCSNFTRKCLGLINDRHAELSNYKQKKDKSKIKKAKKRIKKSTKGFGK